MSESKSYLLETRDMCNAELFLVLQKHIYQGIRHYWNQSKKAVPHGQVYGDFQRRLRQIKNWSQEVIDKEYERLLQETECDYFEDLIRNVIVLNTQIIAFDLHSNVPIKVSVPKGDKFLHRCYTNCGRAFFESIWLMDDRPEFMPLLEQAKNLTKSYKLIQTCIDNTIRSFLPFRTVLKQRLSNEVRGAVSSTGGNHLQTAAGQYYPPVHLSDGFSSSQQHYFDHLPQRLPELDTSSSSHILNMANQVKDYSRLDSLFQPHETASDDAGVPPATPNHLLDDAGDLNTPVPSLPVDMSTPPVNVRDRDGILGDLGRGLDDEFHTGGGVSGAGSVHEEILGDLDGRTDQGHDVSGVRDDLPKDDIGESVMASEQLPDQDPMEKVIFFEPSFRKRRGVPSTPAPSVTSDDEALAASNIMVHQDEPTPSGRFATDDRLDLDVVPVEQANFDVGKDTVGLVLPALQPQPLPHIDTPVDLDDNVSVKSNVSRHDDLMKQFDNMNFFD